MEVPAPQAERPRAPQEAAPGAASAFASRRRGFPGPAGRARQGTFPHWPARAFSEPPPPQPQTVRAAGDDGCPHTAAGTRSPLRARYPALPSPSATAGAGGAQPPPGTGSGSARRPGPRLPQPHQGKAAILPPRHMTPRSGTAFRRHFPPRPAAGSASPQSCRRRGSAGNGAALPLRPGMGGRVNTARGQRRSQDRSKGIAASCEGERLCTIGSALS